MHEHMLLNFLLSKNLLLTSLACVIHCSNVTLHSFSHLQHFLLLYYCVSYSLLIRIQYISE